MPFIFDLSGFYMVNVKYLDKYIIKLSAVKFPLNKGICLYSL